MLGYPFGPENMVNYMNPQASQIDPMTGLPIPTIPAGGTMMPQVPQALPPQTFGQKLGGFMESPQGQMALMSFANSALQSSMNPRIGGGRGLIGALSQGLGAYKQEGEIEEQRRLQSVRNKQATERFEQEKKGYPYEDLQREHGIKGMQRQEEEWAAVPPGTNKKKGDREQWFENRKGEVVLVEGEVTGWDKDGLPQYREISVVPRSAATGGGSDKWNDWKMAFVLAGLDPNVGPTNSAEAQMAANAKKSFGGGGLEQLFMKFILDMLGGQGGGGTPGGGAPANPHGKIINSGPDKTGKIHNQYEDGYID